MTEQKSPLYETLVTRYPIFDRNKEVFAYELYFKPKMEIAGDSRHYQEKNSVLTVVDNYLINGLKILSGGKKIFVNFGWDMLATELPLMFPRDLLGIEIMEKPGDMKKGATTLKKLKEKGYQLLLWEDVLPVEETMIVKMADIVGDDFRGLHAFGHSDIIDRRDGQEVQFLAKSVETLTDFDVAVQNGYEFFQGDFFSKADLIPVRNIPSYKLNFLKILKEINKPEVEFKEIEKILEKDVSITYKLLRFINSPRFGLKKSVDSIHHALILLGEHEVRKWLSLVILSGTGTNKPQELVTMTIIRAKLCESIASKLDQKKDLSRYFLMGMFSTVDAFLDRPMEEILSELPLDEEIKSALLKESDNTYRQILDVVIDYEKGDWKNLTADLKGLNLDEKMISSLYMQAIEWAA